LSPFRGGSEIPSSLSPLSGSIRNLNYLRAKASGCLIKDFGNDGKYYKGALPLYKPPKRKT